MRVKVTDFGTAKLLPEVPTPVLGERTSWNPFSNHSGSVA